MQPFYLDSFDFRIFEGAQKAISVYVSSPEEGLKPRRRSIDEDNTVIFIEFAFDAKPHDSIG